MLQICFYCSTYSIDAVYATLAIYAALAVYATLAIYAAFAVYAALAVYVFFMFFVPVNILGWPVTLTLQKSFYWKIISV